MSQPKQGIPFGSIFAAMLFVVVAVRARDLLGPAGASWTRFALSLLALALALGLIGRRGWARWAGVAFAACVVVLGVRLPDLGAVGLIFVFGASVAGLLLVVPATGDPRPAAATRRNSPAGVALAGAAGLCAAGLLLGLSLPGTQGSDRSESAMPAVRSPDRVAWSDFGRGSELARAEGRPMMVSFETVWCGYCKKLNRTTWKDPEVISRLGEIVAVRVDAEETATRNGFAGRDLAARYQVEGYPTLLVLDSEGLPLSRISGYLDPQQFLEWLEKSLGPKAPRTGGNMQVLGH